MSLEVAVERDIVRRMCGGPDTTEMPDSVIDAILNVEAVRWIGRRRPAHGITYLVTVAEQQDYDAIPPTAYAVEQVWWTQIDWTSFSPTMLTLPDEMSMGARFAGFSTVDNPAIVEAFFEKMKQFERNFKGQGYSVDTPAGRRLRLVPTPANSGEKVWFSYTCPPYASFAAIDMRYAEAIEHFAASRAFKYLAVKRGVVRSGKSWSGGGGENETRQAAELEAAAESMVPVVLLPAVG